MIWPTITLHYLGFLYLFLIVPKHLHLKTAISTISGRDGIIFSCSQTKHVLEMSRLTRTLIFESVLYILVWNARHLECLTETSLCVETLVEVLGKKHICLWSIKCEQRWNFTGPRKLKCIYLSSSKISFPLFTVSPSIPEQYLLVLFG